MDGTGNFCHQRKVLDVLILEIYIFFYDKFLPDKTFFIIFFELCSLIHINLFYTNYFS